MGRIGLVDGDRVDLTNLQRQVLYATGDVGRPKLEAARERLRALNPEVEVVAHPGRLTADNALELIAPYDVVADGTDNFPTRYLVNDACVLAGKPNVSASVFRFEGQVSIFDARRGPCYRCLFPEPPPPELAPSCADAGVLGVLPGIIGSLQALETIKLLLGIGDPLIGRLVLFDALPFRFRELEVRKDPRCPACGDRPAIRDLTTTAEQCGVPAGGLADADPSSISPEELRDRLARGEPVELLDVREPFERAIVRLEGETHIPLGELPARVGELDPARAYAVYCHHGIRSAEAVRFLRRAGFRKLSNLAGGLDAWAARVDRTRSRY